MDGHDLVTGGAGFIGSHLVDELVRRGRRVTVLDDFSTGSRANLDGVSADPNVTVVEGSVSDRALVARLVAGHHRVFHLAAAVGVRQVIERPVRTIETNVDGAAHVLSAAADAGRPVLITSTSEVYGKSAELPFGEDDDVLLGPSSKRRWAYACSKLLDEFLALAHRIESGLPVVVVRLFNTIGPRQTGQYGMVAPTFVSQALAGEPLTVFGDGTQRRCFCDVADVVPALIGLIECADAAGQVVNIGNTRSVSIGELAELVIGIVSSQSKVRLVPYDRAYPAGFEDMSARVPDISRAAQLVGYTPSIDLEDSIRRIAASLKSSDAKQAPRSP